MIARVIPIRTEMERCVEDARVIVELMEKMPSTSSKIGLMAAILRLLVEMNQGASDMEYRSTMAVVRDMNNWMGESQCGN
jgi:hypothetical protein